MKKNEKSNETMLLTLCHRCAEQFYNSYEHSIRRVDLRQQEKESCSYCSVRQGFDYLITHKTSK
jgi:mRNA interferase MazF